MDIIELLRKAYIQGSWNEADSELKHSFEDFLDENIEDINYTHSCTTLKDKESPTLKDAFIAGYKKRALMSGLKYDKVSELNAISLFKCWMSFDLNL